MKRSKQHIFAIAILAAILCPLGIIAAGSAAIQKTWLEHNVIHDGRKCLAIHSKISVEGLKNKKVEIAAYVMKDAESGLADTNGKYCSRDGFVSAGETLKIPYATSTWGDHVIYLPNDEIHAEDGDGVYYIRIYVNHEGNHLARGVDMPFMASSLSDNTRESDTFDPAIKRWKENETKKGFTIVTEMPDGTRTSQQWQRCEACKGDLRCPRCSGTGKCKACGGKKGTSSTYTMYYECVECSRTGRCALCKSHVGKCKCAMGEYPGYVLEQDPDYTPQPGGEWWNTI